MAYYYNGSKILAPLSIVSRRVAFHVETMSLKQSTLLTPAQRWELTFSVLMNDDEGEVFAAHTWDFFDRKKMIMPQLTGVLSKYSFNGDLQVGTAAVPGDDIILVKSSSQTGTATIPVGTFITFANHSKVYSVTSALSFGNGTNNIQLKIFPNLVAPVSINTIVQFGDDCEISYKLDMTSGQGIVFSDGIMSNPGSIKIIESL
ncbi:hypothetical protein EOK75_17140 (plasmid) [Pseudorhodobacter turbinis]|uniref:Uncharacterized protein n=1 Tax=Pseudorhodobacter turbinis TaxID=2500533 RepID=A0A4P8EKA7_9RHOB|nr:hypothetical protein [Pseudorhodobacter turbinis]QCO57439.1 hypothetical protein EOK75_17140 [Pseudorhodobacter turbinis]